LGAHFDANHELLCELGVSNATLNNLVISARNAGAYGAKLTGAGLGGCIIAVVAPDLVSMVRDALEGAGSPWVQHCRLEGD
jgi:mevalonate kinase